MAGQRRLGEDPSKMIESTSLYLERSHQTGCRQTAVEICSGVLEGNKEGPAQTRDIPEQLLAENFKDILAKHD